ncbi:MAG: hypothetical protein [Caudoviricetes sp.]|nr:MAG: hypothetical protein [Caudoviricetes sp.]
MSSSDRELLELAAKAIGINVRWHDGGYYGPTMEIMECEAGGSPWNPLTDDGDAFRLMLALQIDVSFWREDDSVCVSIHQNLIATAVGAIGDIELRRAIVRAAAEIGRSMP